MRKQNHIFISYKREESSFALALRQALRAENIKIWWDNDLQTGQKWSEELDKALLEADTIVVIWSKLSVNSDWVRHEASIGKIRSVLTHVKIDEVEIPGPFNSIQAVDLSKWDQNEKHAEFQKLITSIKRIRKSNSRKRFTKLFMFCFGAALCIGIGVLGGYNLKGNAPVGVSKNDKNVYIQTQGQGVFELKKNDSLRLGMPDKSTEIFSVSQIFSTHGYLYIAVNGKTNKLSTGESISIKNSNCKIILLGINKEGQSGKFEFICG